MSHEPLFREVASCPSQTSAQTTPARVPPLQTILLSTTFQSREDPASMNELVCFCGSFSTPSTSRDTSSFPTFEQGRNQKMSTLSFFVGVTQFSLVAELKSFFSPG
jgi:hypothetical protein